MKARVSTIVTVLGLLASTGAAQTTAGVQANGLSLDEAISQAIAREPSLRAARADVEAARGMRLQAGLRPNPSASIERREEPGGMDSQTMVSVEWPLDLFRRSGRVRVADRELEAMQLSTADRERMLASEVRMRYGEAAAAIRDLAVADQFVAAAGKQHDLLRARVSAGGAPPIERDLLDVELQRLESERLLAAGRADAALVELKRWLGLEPEAPLTLRDSLEALVVSEAGADVAPASADLARERSDVREAEARVRLADARLEQARREGRADVSLFGSYARMDAGFPQLGIGMTGSLEPIRGIFNYVSGGAMVMVPLLNRNQGQVAAANAARAGAAAQLEATRLSAQAEIASAQIRVTHARRAVKLYSSGVLDLARKNLSVVSQTFQLGRATVFDVLAEQRRLLDVERAYTAALSEAWQATTALKRATGEVR